MCHRKCHCQVSWNTCLLSPRLSFHTLSDPFNAGHQTGSPFSDLGLVISEPREEEFSDFLGKENRISPQVSGPHNPHSSLTGKAGICTQTCLTLAHFVSLLTANYPCHKRSVGSVAGPEGAWTRQCSVFPLGPVNTRELDRQRSQVVGFKYRKW